MELIFNVTFPFDVNLQTEEILYDVERGWMVSPRMQALIGNDWEDRAYEGNEEDDDGVEVENDDESFDHTTSNKDKQNVDTSMALRRRKPTIKVGKIEIPKTVIEMLEKEARRQEKAALKSKRSVEAANKRSTWTSLRIVGGSVSGTRLRSPQDQTVR